MCDLGSRGDPRSSSHVYHHRRHSRSKPPTNVSFPKILTLCVVGVKGGALVDKVHSFTSHGDPYIRHFAHTLLHKITRPWYEMLKTWIYAGQLRDPFQEFFVFETPTPQRKKGGGEGSA